MNAFRFFLHKKSIHIGLPLLALAASSGKALTVNIPSDRLYKIGPFYCDKSPHSHKGKFEHAIDFIVKDGNLVRAAKAGTIVDIVESNTMYGATEDYAKFVNYVTIDHGSFYSQYAHLERNSPSLFGLHTGKKVVRGQTIGIVGKSGWIDFGSEGDHLHFMLFRTSDRSFESLPAHFDMHHD